MGLDMYLNKMPRYRNITAKKVCAIENYFSWVKAKESGDKYANCTFKEWCGYDFNDLPSLKTIEFYRQFYHTKYAAWDTEHKYGSDRIMEEVGYWRKANAIHEWFVRNVQDDIDDCSYHHEVTKEILEKLLDTCTKVLDNCKVVNGPVKNGSTYSNGEWKDEFIEGRVIVDPTVAMELLPTQDGFFFGGTDYDEWYLNDIENTIEIVQKVLKTTDFDKEMIYYVSSW